MAFRKFDLCKGKSFNVDIHYQSQESIYSDEFGTAYTGPAICGAIGSYATHYPVLVNCERCREILRAIRANGGPGANTAVK
jgi:hypothetical protein